MLTKGNFTGDEWNNLLHLFKYHPFELHLLHRDFQLDELLQDDGGKDAGTTRRRKTCGKIEICSDEPVFLCSDKSLILDKSDCIQKSGDTHSYGDA